MIEKLKFFLEFGISHFSKIAVVTNLIFLTLFISLIFIHTILGEQIHHQTCAGLVLINIGIVIQEYNEYRTKKNIACS